MSVDLDALPAIPSTHGAPSAGREGNVVAFPVPQARERARRIPEADIVLIDVGRAHAPEPPPVAAAVAPKARRPNLLRIVLIILLAIAIGWNIVLRRDMWATSITVPIPDNPSHQLA